MSHSFSIQYLPLPTCSLQESFELSRRNKHVFISFKQIENIYYLSVRITTETSSPERHYEYYESNIKLKLSSQIKNKTECIYQAYELYNRLIQKKTTVDATHKKIAEYVQILKFPSYSSIRVSTEKIKLSSSVKAFTDSKVETLELNLDRNNEPMIRIVFRNAIYGYNGIEHVIDEIFSTFNLSEGEKGGISNKIENIQDKLVEEMKAVYLLNV